MLSRKIEGLDTSGAVWSHWHLSRCITHTLAYLSPSGARDFMTSRLVAELLGALLCVCLAVCLCGWTIITFDILANCSVGCRVDRDGGKARKTVSHSSLFYANFQRTSMGLKVVETGLGVGYRVLRKSPQNLRLADNSRN